MAGFSLREAAHQAGTSKSTVLRAIQSGRLSAGRTADGGYSIDPAELFRVYPPKLPPVALDRSMDHSAGHGAPPSETPGATEALIRNAQLQAQIDALKELLATEKRRAEELREDRDRWHSQAERLAIAPPPRNPKGIFGWLRRA